VLAVRPELTNGEDVGLPTFAKLLQERPVQRSTW
jgi:hypothetical protein